jgi:nucleotide-binding universal stress UspA family protein
MFSHILVPLNGSHRAERVLSLAARIARSTSGLIHLIQIRHLPMDYGGNMAPVPLLSERMIESEVAAGRKYLNTIALEQLAGIETTISVKFGSPSQCILSAVAEQQVDFIVLCSHGRTGIKRWALGSVAYTLAHESSVPIFIIRDDTDTVQLARSDRTQPLRAFVPLDDSQLSETALSPAVHLVAALAAPGQRALHLAQIVTRQEEVAASDESSIPPEEKASTYLAHVAKRVQTILKDLKLSVDCSVVSQADVAEALANIVFCCMCKVGRGNL